MAYYIEVLILCLVHNRDNSFLSLSSETDANLHQVFQYQTHHVTLYL
jgi:hypothetical protein